MDRGAWQAAVPGVTRSQTLLSMHMYTILKAKWPGSFLPSTIFGGNSSAETETQHGETVHLGHVTASFRAKT